MATVDPETLKQLQQQVLDAVLAQAPLPGREEILHFPDLNLWLQQDEKIVSSDNLAGGIEVGVPVVFASAGDIAARAKEKKQIALLKFRPAESLGDRVRLTLELQMTFDDVAPLPLGAVTAVFADVPGIGWRAVEPPAALGY